MKRFFLAALLLFAAVAFTGCDNDDDDLYDTLSGRVWAGDLGFYQDGRIPLDSYVYFGADGFGTDELRYADTGRYLDTLNIQWTPTTTKSTSATGGPITRANCATYTSAGAG